MANLIKQQYPRITKLRAITTGTHQSLDDKVMSYQPYESNENYIKFLKFQHQFMNKVAPLYQSQQLTKVFYNLQSRCRLNYLKLDLADFNQSVTAVNDNEMNTLSLPAAIGWLYVIEGSKLGAAILAKEVGKLNLTGEYGARFLAGPGNGRGSAWREFMQSVESIELSDQEEQMMLDGALNAFMYVHSCVDNVLARN